jgi:hypothetical protein
MWFGQDLLNAWTSLKELPWDEDGLCHDLSCQIEFLQQLAFAKKPRVTLAIVNQFSNDLAKLKYYDRVDVPRVKLNFLEVVLPAYRHFTESGSKISVVYVPPKRDDDWQEGWNYRKHVDVTWKAKLMDEVYSRVCSFPLRYPSSRLTGHLVTEDALLLSEWSAEDEDAHEAGKADQGAWCATPRAGERRR